MKLEYTEEKTWTDDLGTHRTETATKTRGAAKKARTLKKDLARLGKAIGKIAVFIFALAVAVAIVATVYLLLGWLLAAALAFITSGAVALSVFQGSVALLLLTFVAALFRD